MTDMPANPTFLPGGCFPPPPKPFNFDPHTGLPIEYDTHGNPYSPIVLVAPPELPEGVTGYDPYSGKPLGEDGRPVYGEHNPYGQHTFTTRLEDRGGVDPAGHVIAQRPVYDPNTGWPVQYDENGNGMYYQIGIVPPPGVHHWDEFTGEPVDENGDVVPGVGNPHRMPQYDTETGLPITYGPNGTPLVPNIHVENPPGVHGYDPDTGQPLDEYGAPLEGVENPNWLPEDRPFTEPEGLPNFDPQTGLPLEYDENGNPYPAVEPDDAPILPEGVAGYDPYTGEPVDENGKVVEGEDNPYGEHTFTTNLEDREGVDPSGHVVAQRPMYDEDSGLPIYYNNEGRPYTFNVDTEKPDGVYTYDEKTGEPLDIHGKPVEGAENPYQRPNYDASTGRPMQYDQNGYQVPQPPVYLPPQPDDVAGYDPRTGEPVDSDGNPVEGATNPWLLDENDIFYPKQWEPTIDVVPGDDIFTQDETGDIFDNVPDEGGDIFDKVPDEGGDIFDQLPDEPTDTGDIFAPTSPENLGEGGDIFGEKEEIPGDIFGKTESPAETTFPTTEPTDPKAEEVTVPEQRDTDAADPFAHTEAPKKETLETTVKEPDAGTELRDEPVSQEPATTEPAAETATSHESASLDAAPESGADAADQTDPVAAG